VPSHKESRDLNVNPPSGATTRGFNTCFTQYVDNVSVIIGKYEFLKRDVVATDASYLTTQLWMGKLSYHELFFITHPACRDLIQFATSAL
jgi:hypothetical protein